MNKARRQEISKLKQKKRCNELGLNPKEHYEYKEQGKPCSCYMCSGTKHSRKTKHKSKDDEL